MVTVFKNQSFIIYITDLSLHSSKCEDDNMQVKGEEIHNIWSTVVCKIHVPNSQKSSIIDDRQIIICNCLWYSDVQKFQTTQIAFLAKNN